MSYTKKIIIAGLMSGFLYSFLFLFNPIRKLLGDQALVMSINNFFIVIVTILILNSFVYFMAKDFIFDKKAFKFAMIFFLIFNTALFFIKPLTSSDVYTYIYSGRVLSVHQTNPYVASFDSFSNDPYSKILKNRWSGEASAYPPLFMMISSVVTLIGKNSLTLSLYLFKLIFVILNILCCFLIHKIFKNPQATFLYAWNPFILFEFSLNAHNDVLTIFFFLLALFFVYNKPLNNKNLAISIFFMWCSVLIKYISAFFLPIYLLVLLKQKTTRLEKINFSILSIGVSFLTLFIFYAPFWTGTEIFSRVISHTSHVYNTLVFSSICIIIISGIFSLFNIANFKDLAALTGKSLFLLGYTSMIIKLFFTEISNSKQTLILYLTLSLAIFYLTFFTWFMPWYLTLLITLLIISFAVSGKKYYTFITLGITLYGILYYIILR